jgi:Bacteriocin-protection, YdeI or OmpD-Associated/Domain of unknown function (DUF1905)
MTQKYQFRAKIENAGDGGAYVNVPMDVENTFGKKRLKIRATIDGEPYRGTLVRMGGPQHILLVLKEIRERIGKSFGDEVSVEFEEDLDPRKVDVPPDLQHALDVDLTAHTCFDSLSYTHQKEYVRWITDAKRDQTRQKRILKTIDMLKQGKNEH